MAADKLVDSSALDTNLTSIANAIRTKTGGSSALAFPSGFVSAIGTIKSKIGTKTVTNNDATASSISFSSLSGMPIAFFVRCKASISRNSSYRYYFVNSMCYDGTNTVGTLYYQYSGQVSNVTSGYSYTYNNGTLTLTSSGGRSASPGSFYNGDYELVYIY